MIDAVFLIDDAIKNNPKIQNPKIKKKFLRFEEVPNPLLRFGGDPAFPLGPFYFYSLDLPLRPFFSATKTDIII